MESKCPRCGGIFIPNFIDNKLVNKCCSCGYIDNDEMQIGSNKTFKTKFNTTRKNIVEDKDKLIVISHLKECREKKNISQRQIADIFGFAEQRYGTVERNYNAPSVVLVAQLAYILDVQLHDLYKPIKISKSWYNEIRSLKIEKNNNNLVHSEELDNIICEMESLNEKIKDFKINTKERTEIFKKLTHGIQSKWNELTTLIADINKLVEVKSHKQLISKINDLSDKMESFNMEKSNKVDSIEINQLISIMLSILNELRELVRKQDNNGVTKLVYKIESLSSEIDNFITINDRMHEIEEFDKKSSRYKELKKIYDKQIASAFLKQGELVESSYWNTYLKTKTPEEIKKNIKTLD